MKLRLFTISIPVVELRPLEKRSIKKISVMSYIIYSTYIIVKV
jgi:hypothetical protein